METQKASIRINDLSIGYNKGNPLFPSFSIDASQGELIALVGRNGVGKSTLIKTIIGQISPLSGSVSIIDKNVTALTRQERSMLLSYVPAEPVRVANLFIRDFVAVGRFPYLGWTRSLSTNDWKVVDQSLSLVGISHLAHRDISTVSDGERQRAMIAFALAQDTKIILLDEPTAFLDLPNKFEMVHLLSRLAHDNQKTIIYSTHDLQGAIHEADIIWMMLEKGLKSGAPEELALNDQFKYLLSNTQVVFDSNLGVFKNSRQCTKQIALEGNGEVHKWTLRMLQRLDYKVVDSNVSGLKITITNEGDSIRWMITDENRLIFETRSITELSRRLRGL